MTVMFQPWFILQRGFGIIGTRKVCRSILEVLPMARLSPFGKTETL